MNRKHSFLARSLALLLALVMILSNANLGFVLNAQAATVNASLFELIAESNDVGTKELNAILAYADALPELNDDTVTYETAPEDAVATLITGVLAAKEVNGWVPYSYTVGDETKYFAGDYEVTVGESAPQATVTYKYDLNKDQQVADALEEIAYLADQAGQQAAALDGISGGNTMTALMMLDYDFTWDIIDTIDALTLADVGIDVNQEVDVDAYLDEYVDEYLDTYLDEYLNGDLNEDGVVNELDKAIADNVDREELRAELKEELKAELRDELQDKLEEELNAKAEEELEKVKAEYIATIEALQDRMVMDGTDGYDGYYYDIPGKRGPQYDEQLTIYAMLKEYKNDGLVHFYEHGANIITEMDKLGDVLFNILGEKDENGVYANTEVINALFVKMDAADVDTSMLAELANRMKKGAETLTALDSFKTHIDASYENLAELCDALAACGTVTGYNTDLCLYSNGYTVLDDSKRVVSVVLGETGIPCYVEVVTNEALTEEAIAKILAEIEKVAKHYDVDTAPVEALLGTVMTENVEVTCSVELKTYDVKLVITVDGVEQEVGVIEVSADAAAITLPVVDGHTVTYKIGENVYVVSYADEKATEIAINIDDVASGALKIEVLSDENNFENDLVALVEKINANLGREAVVLTAAEDGTFTAMDVTIAMDELVTFAQTYVMDGMTPVALNNSEFIVEDAGTPLINMQALIDAMLNDESFSSEKMIAMGEGRENNLLTTTMQVPGYDMAFTLNLTAMPEKMATVSKGLSAIENYFWYESNNGVLDINVNLPEKVYEAYLTAAIGAGYVDDENVNLNHKVALQFLEDCMNMMLSTDVDAVTVTNTLKAVGVDKDLSGYNSYYDMVKKLVNYDGFSYNINDNDVDFAVTGDKYHIEMIMDLLGLEVAQLEMGMKLISDEDITGKASVNIVNEAPHFEALVVEPGKINDAGIKNKLNTIDYTENLVAKAPTTGKVAAVMLLDDVNGNLNFGGNVILDLNGKTVNGSINVNGKIVIVDSNLATYEGGKVTGTVYANGGAILGGTYGGDVSAFLRDGYFQENGSVRNAMYYVTGNSGNYTYVLNADFYQLCDGYLPSVEALAAEIATDVALNAYPAAGMAYNGKTMYALNLESILNSYLGNGIGGAADALLTDLTAFVNVEGVNALANDIIDDLCDLEAMAAALVGSTELAHYNFTSYPAVVEFVHNEESNTMDISFVANFNHGKSFGIGLAVEGSNDYYEYGKKLLTAMSEIVSIDAQVTLNQPTYNAASNTVSVSGNGTAGMVIDFGKDINYTKGIAIILAYGNPVRAEELMNAKNCVAELNKIIATMTVEEVFTALKVMNRDVSMAEMAEAVGYKYDAAEIAELEKIYHILLCGMGKVLEKFDVTGNDTLLSAFADGEGSYTIAASNKEVDATVKGFTGVATLEYAELSLTIKLAEKCDKLIGDVDYDGDVDASDAAWILKYDAMFDNIDMHWCVADVDADNDVDASDAAWILKYDALMCEYEDFPAVNP